MIAVIANTHRDFAVYSHASKLYNKSEMIYISSPEKIRGLDITAVIDLTYIGDEKLNDLRYVTYDRLFLCMNKRKAEIVRLENEKKKLTEELNQIKSNWLYKLGRLLTIHK